MHSAVINSNIVRRLNRSHLFMRVIVAASRLESFSPASIGYNLSMDLPRYRLISLFALTTGIAAALGFTRTLIYRDPAAVVILGILSWAFVILLLAICTVWTVSAFKRD